MALSTVYHILLLTIGLFCAVVVAQEEANPESPPNRYYIGTPEFEQETVDLFLHYPVSDFVPYRNLNWKIFDGPECGGGSNEITDYQEYLSIDLTHAPESEYPEGDGTTFRNITLSLSFDPDTIRSSPIISEEGLDTVLGFCVSLGAYTADRINPGAVEVFYAETFVRLLILQNGDFDIEESVTVRPERIGEQRERQEYFLIGFLCNATNHEIVDPEPIYQGQTHRVCVTPTPEALRAGVYMRAIDSFSWTRLDIYQPAIVPPAEPAPLTEVDCEPGMEICSFETLFKAAFFYKLGRIDGMGTGWLQFGRGEYVPTRRATILTRQLQSPPEGAGSSGFAGNGLFQVDAPVARYYTAEGFLCDSNNQRLDPYSHPLTFGQVARVCVTPTGLALNDNVKIRSIDYFTWGRQDLGLSQEAILTNEQAVSGTEIICVRGQEICAFETLLEKPFFDSVGGVGGSGVVWLQFGSESRRVQVALTDTFLSQMEPDFAGASPFSAYIIVLPPIDERVLYGCRAYECNELDREIVSAKSKEEGASVRICVAPTFDAAEAGASMWSVEWWTWQRKNFTQPAIVEQGEESPDGLTLQMCERGMDYCVFQTRLRPEFFNDTGAMEGNGECWITFGSGFRIPGRIEIEVEEVDPEVREVINPLEDPLYAGGNPIAMIFPVTGNYTIPKLICEEDHELKKWWKEEDDNVRMGYIGIMVATGASFCCLFVCAFCSNRRRQDEFKESAGGNIVINVGIQDTQHTESRTHNHLEERTHNTIETSESSKSMESIPERKRLKGDDGPSDDDVCFDAKDHAGTKAMGKVVKKYIRDNPKAFYGPPSYQIIKGLLDDRRFYIRAKSSKPWREASKKEIISELGECWREQKSKING